MERDSEHETRNHKIDLLKTFGVDITIQKFDGKVDFDKSDAIQIRLLGYKSL